MGKVVKHGKLAWFKDEGQSNLTQTAPVTKKRIKLLLLWEPSKTCTLVTPQCDLSIFSVSVACILLMRVERCERGKWRHLLMTHILK